MRRPAQVAAALVMAMGAAFGLAGVAQAAPSDGPGPVYGQTCLEGGGQLVDGPLGTLGVHMCQGGEHDGAFIVPNT
jgi:hypothetical protein